MTDQLQVEPCDAEELNLSPIKTASGMLYSRQSSINHLFRLTMLSNHAGEKVVMVFGAESPGPHSQFLKNSRRPLEAKLDLFIISCVGPQDTPDVSEVANVVGVVDSEGYIREQRDIDQMGRWAEEWQMEFNLDKCVVLHFGKTNQGRTYTLN
eukprot:g39527.t1